MSTFIKDFIERETISRRNFMFASAVGAGALMVPGLNGAARAAIMPASPTR